MLFISFSEKRHLQDEPDSHGHQPSGTTPKFDGDWEPDQVDETVHQDGMVLNVTRFREGNIEFDRPGDEENRWSKTGRIAEQSEEDDTKQVKYTSAISAIATDRSDQPWGPGTELDQVQFPCFWRGRDGVQSPQLEYNALLRENCKNTPQTCRNCRKTQFHSK